MIRSALRCRSLSSLASTSTSSAAGDVTGRQLYTPVIGLEVHVQLNTRTKLFSRTAAGVEAGPNRLVGAFDMASPGTMPALNKQAVLHALKMGLLLRCRIPEASRFDRKHYFYADMPAGYQITQSEMPIAKDGTFGFYVFDENIQPYWKEVAISQLQLEQDSGKSIHFNNQTLIDLNRAGCALVEVVTTPCLATALEAICLVQHLRLLLIHHGLCLGELHKGHMRVDANVSLTFEGRPGTRIEVKNMNSIRCLHTAINYEIERQFRLLAAGELVQRETRAADPDGRTVPMREKEDDTDYRFMPEPNLPLLKVRGEWLRRCRDELDEQPPPRFERLRDELGFDARTALHFAEEDALAAFAERCAPHVAASGGRVAAADVVATMRDLKVVTQRSKIAYPPAGEKFAEAFVKLIELCNEGRITRLRVLELLRAYAGAKETRPVVEVLDAEDWWKVDDAAAIARLVAATASRDAATLAKARDGHVKSRTRLRNACIDAGRKCVDVERIDDAVDELLRQR